MKHRTLNQVGYHQRGSELAQCSFLRLAPVVSMWPGKCWRIVGYVNGVTFLHRGGVELQPVELHLITPVPIIE